MNKKVFPFARNAFFALLVAGFSGLVNALPLPAGWISTGNAGTFNTADGDITLAPGLPDYQWISTNGGVAGVGILPDGAVGGETDGSSMHTTTFDVAAGDVLKFYFQYITSDGSGFSDYAWAGLFSGTSTFESYLFTARTTPTGDTVPGFDLPGLGSGVTLTPSTSAIIAAETLFSPLGGDSGLCYNGSTNGCGRTGWIEVTSTFATAGTYSLGFGVTNYLDSAYDSAFAVAGVKLNDASIDDAASVPEPGTLALMGLGLLGMTRLRRKAK